jgi:hypothetical protein
VLRDNVAEGTVPVAATLAGVACHAALLGWRAREADDCADRPAGG